MSKKEVSASLAGSVSLGGKVSVHRLGYGAMRLTGDGICVHLSLRSAKNSFVDLTRSAT
jgi:hypothetical protein